MKLQLLSDLHFEQTPAPNRALFTPAPEADLLILAGDIDRHWSGLQHFSPRHGWPVPVVLIAGNHEFDQRELPQAWDDLRRFCDQLHIDLIECESRLLHDSRHTGRRIRLLGTIRWADYDLYGAGKREKAFKAANWYLQQAGTRQFGQAFDAAAMRGCALNTREWLDRELSCHASPGPARWDTTVVVTHFGPSRRSVDPRYGDQPGSAGFCNADEDLVVKADLWLHGHVHCRHDYWVGQTRVVANPRGHEVKNEPAGWQAHCVVEV